MLDELTAQRGFVLATGGGAVLAEHNRHILRERGFVIWLDAPVDVQIARLERDQQRPLLRAPDRRARLRKLAAERNSLYARTADLHFRATNTSTSAQVARDLVGLLKTHWQRDETGVAA
jgi:shikimate kinase